MHETSRPLNNRTAHMIQVKHIYLCGSEISLLSPPPPINSNCCKNTCKMALEHWSHWSVITYTTEWNDLSWNRESWSCRLFLPEWEVGSSTSCLYLNSQENEGTRIKLCIARGLWDTPRDLIILNWFLGKCILLYFLDAASTSLHPVICHRVPQTTFSGIQALWIH